MSEKEINIAIAEACGWAHPSVKPYAFPDYLNDLNAMHEAERVLKGEQRDKYLDYLYEMANPDSMIEDAWKLNTSTARQRAEAFLRTIKQWKEEAK